MQPIVKTHKNFLKLTSCDKREHISVYFKLIQFGIANTKSVFSTCPSQNQK